ncbi:hypothetical protein ABIE13_005028 [Ottowia thiooxydans]|uniref:Uncharacterized protein n=1 Tax=Ottowia thiooxydans TaxID=219182 RepID=A0ABV2QFS7_9BURK
MSSPLSRLRAFPPGGTQPAAGQSPLRGHPAWPAPRPFDLGPSPGRGRGRCRLSLATDTCRAERSNGPSRVFTPFGRAEERRARGGQEHCKMLLLRELACGSCLSVLSEAKAASSAAPPLDRAPQVARSEAQGRGRHRHGQWGRLFLRQVLLADHRSAGRKKVAALPGALPGLRPQGKSRRQVIDTAPKITAVCPHRTAGPPTLSRRERE